MSQPNPQVLSVLHNWDQRILEEDYVRISRFLQSATEVRDREWEADNGEFFHIVATQSMAYASLQYLFGREATVIIETARYGLRDMLLGLELGHPIEPLAALDYFCVALAINDRGSAFRIASAPEDNLGFLDDPDSPLPILTSAAFALFAEQDSESRSALETLHGILFEMPLDKTYKTLKPEMANLYQLLLAIQDGDTSTFNDRLPVRGQLRLDRANEGAEEDTVAFIDWTGLGLVCLARERGIPVSAHHVLIPLDLLATNQRLRRH